MQIFIQRSAITFPVLRNAGYLAAAQYYGLRRDNYLVIDRDGIVRYTSVDEPFSGVNDAAIRAAIEPLLRVPIAGVTWSTIKGLHR